MAFVDFSKFYKVPFTTTQTLSRDGFEALRELARRSEVTGSPTATDVSFTPSGGLSSTNVQDALVELDLEKVPTTRTVNGHALSANVTVTAADAGADATGTASAAIAAHNAAADPHPQYALDTDLAGFVPVTRTVNGHALSANVTVTASDVGLGSVTNDAQTKAAIVPNTAPSAGQLLVGNAGGTAYAPVGSSGDVTVSSAGAFTIGNDKVTYAKMQNVSAASKLLGRGSAAGSGDPEEITVGSGLTMTGTTLSASGAGTGDVVGPASAVDGNVVLFDGTTGKLVKDGGGRKTMLANVTLGSSGTSLASGAITACAFLEIHIYIEGYSGSDTASLQFNGAAGTAYRYRWLTCASGATTFTAGLVAASTDRIKVDAANTTTSRRVVAFISNDSSITEKLVRFESVFGTGSAATQATITLGNGAWVSGAATQITSVSLVSTSNMLAGTKMTIFGWN